MSEKRTIRVAGSESGRRLDRVLADRLEVPRNQIQQWIRSGHVSVNGSSAKASHLVAAGDTVVCQIPPRDVRSGMEPEAGDLVILHEDDEIVVIDKPAGLVVHPGAGRSRGTLAHRLLAHFPELAEVGGRGRPGIVHRLDKDTTGVMVVARTPKAYEELSAAFARRQVQKRYLALVYGVPKLGQGRIEEPIGRHPRRRKEMTVQARGRPAVTGYRLIESAAGICLLELDLETGRTHQIRVHLKSLGHPLIGDPTYGEARWKALASPVRGALRSFPRPALHAWRLRLTHPGHGREMELVAPPPSDLQELWRQATGRSFPAGDRLRREDL